MIKRLMLLFIVFYCGLTLKAQQDAAVPSADEIIATYLESTGGVEKWKALQTMKMEASMSMQGMEFPGIIYSKRPNKQRVEVNVMGTEMIQAYDGKIAWWINPLMGSIDAQPMPGEMSEQMTKDQFEDDFIDYREKGHQVEYLGMEEVKGASCYVLRLTKADGDVEQHYFDTEYLVPIMQRSTVEEGPMKGQVVDTFVSDYQEVSGFMIPHFMETIMGGQTIQKISISLIELNIEIEDELFDYPKKE